MALMVKTLSIVPENRGDSSYISVFVFASRLKTILDAILTPRSQYLPLEYIVRVASRREGGDFRDTLR